MVLSNASPRSSSYWYPPSQDAYKLNFDAVVLSDLKCYGVGVIIRNFTGEVMAGMSAKGEYVHNSDEAEALACRKALKFSMEAGFSNLVIEGDNSNVMRAIVSFAVNNCLYGHIVDDIRHYISGRQFVAFSCVKREGNMVAHSLARFARNIVDDLYWMEDEPPPTVDALHHDRLHINE
ncbi:uncharacterized protein LOC142620548 [Castanea sativa]|uniref:uncharacterized protein LOC142620548 n=1 Tax=Castanea sativa TaxID=21020 RepID=UPI003F649376